MSELAAEFVSAVNEYLGLSDNVDIPLWNLRKKNVYIHGCSASRNQERGKETKSN